ncbi:glycoside hydrolase family 53 protein [Glycomyces buryatensis]|uniref:Arabinogalactan endo-beta-1,4-galactanase n=1 Tax=Glycomyces buryatensis TaxID=2570927 RepID=A0A4S8PV50_9ACTN|nr:arabinogalactan endo-1,4-beta-galactosidase [Glycomyces buryatensis]THV33642.1 arabinogalactan endo-1,4-beta-galactosidase [Glycomyces buryatensis]
MRHRTALTAVGAFGVAAAAATPALADSFDRKDGKGKPKQPAFVRGADISTLPKNEDNGAVYYAADGTENDAVSILAASGLGCIRLKVWVDPADGYNTKTQVVDMASRAKAAGMDVMIDFHYSDFWCDPGQQAKPAAWANLDFSGLMTAVYDHTADVLGAVVAAGVDPSHVQVGNETNGGFLWPDGRYDQLDQMAQLMTSGSNAVRDTAPGAEVLLHLAEGGNNDVFRWFFDAALDRDVPFDAIGASYYPYWHGALSGLESNLGDMASRYGKPIYVVETAYPFTTEDADGHENVMYDAEPVSGYPSTPDGQSAMLTTVADVVKAVPNGLGRGLFWWEAAWTGVEGSGWDPTDPSAGNAWENQALFDFDGKALPSLKTLGTL